ncbi:hypothetical protein C7974DRAFT_414594 [Boeremia exigua]|uniref:uncharacterized protein n=1 Tax=Boeremia exigua TaxID=749465 RepID=UPI001E8EB074|nr:uncharacterized protein C7974DRAFT_414594 [Boeremia exigua]KAH6621912.1 hypothetical protein C7974DRAFT_414594 [Boeremia exigua]
MQRYSLFVAFGDGQDVSDDRYDAAELSTYGQFHGPSSNAYSDGTPHENSDSSSRSFRQSPYDEHGYPIEGVDAGDGDLHRRAPRNQAGESSIPQSDPRVLLGRDDQRPNVLGHRSNLSDRIDAKERQARRETFRERRQQQTEDEYLDELVEELAELQELGALDPLQEARELELLKEVLFDGCIHRAYVEARSEQDERKAWREQRRMKQLKQQQREYDETASNVRKYGRGTFPSYEFC